MRFFALDDPGPLASQIARHLSTEIAPHEMRDFGAGEHKGRPLVSVRGQSVIVLSALHGAGGLSTNDRLIRLLFFLGACRDHGAARVTALVPYLPYGRKDRRTKSRDPLGSRYVAQLFEAVGVDEVITVDAHNPAAFENAFRREALNLATAELFATHIAGQPGEGPLVVLSPDSGGVKRAQLLREALETHVGGPVGFALMEKRRSSGVISGDLFAGDVAGARVWIVDDMIVGGDTMIRAAKACRARDAREVHLVATHALFGPEVAGRLVDEEADSVVVSDAVPLKPGTAETLGKRLGILSLGPRLAEVITRHCG